MPSWVDEHEKYQEYLRKNFVAILNDRSVPSAARCGCMNEVVRSTLSDAFERGNTDETVGAAKDLALQTVDLITQDDVATVRTRRCR